MGHESEFVTLENEKGIEPATKKSIPSFHVCRETDTLIKIFEGAKLNDPEPLREFIGNSTIPLIDSARAAIPLVHSLAGEVGPDDPRDLAQIIEESKDKHDLTEQLGIFNLSAVIFSQIPETFRSPYFPAGFSRRGMLRPPTTVADYQQRFDELDEVATRLVEGKMKRTSRPSIKPNVMRVEAFFDAFKRLLSPSEGV